MYQNKAICTGDFIQGCLLDNFLVQCEHGIAAVYEHFLNEWSSCYLVRFGKTDNDKLMIHHEFYERMEDER
jgi:hypothetical protein